MRIRLVTASAAVALMLSAPAFAQQPSRAPSPAANQDMSATSPGQQQLDRADLAFVKRAAQGGMAEVELGKLAQQNAQDAQVKQFGQKMEQDHSNANQQLESLASQKGVQLPKQLDAKDQKEMDRLSRLKGPAFDQAYMRMMVQDHDKDIKEFKREAQTARDPDVKNFAQQTLNVIEQHDQMAHNITRSMTATGSSRQRR
jgi:putative membrane protein